VICEFARDLGDEELATITELEQDLGVVIVAFACRSVDPAREARIQKAMAALGPMLQAPPVAADEVQLVRIRAAEQRLGLSLVAVTP
jgi:hypothetical protein